MSNGTIPANDCGDDRNDPRSPAFPTRRSALKLLLCAAVTFASRTLGQESQERGDGAVWVDRVLQVNPYAGVDWDRAGQFKTNLHTHTIQSDGRMVPSRVIEECHARGYHALAITDHNRSTWPWTAFERDPAAVKMLGIAGNELSRHHHVLSLFSNYETLENDLDAAVAGVAEAGGLAIVCHPAMHWVPEHSPASGMRVPMSPPLRAITRSDFTVETWFRTTDAGRNVLHESVRFRSPDRLTSNGVERRLHPARAERVLLQLDPGKIDGRLGEFHAK